MSGLTQFLMREVEMPTIEVVAAMEDTGYLIDIPFFFNLRDRLAPEIKTVLRQIRKVAGPKFNPNSNKQLVKLLYDKLGLKVGKRTKKGAPSTDDETLTRLAKQHKIAAKIARHRKLNKIVSTYCSIPEQVDSDGRLRVQFNQLAAETGRFSSSSVIQTLPKKDEFEIRKGFRATDGSLIVAADFRQQELNVLAQVCGDKNMLAAIKSGLDLHGLAAVKVFGLTCNPNAVETEHPDKRDQIKAIQFGLIYGRSPYGLSQILSISQQEAEQLSKEYFQQFPAVLKFIARVHGDLLRAGYVDDVFGRRRHLPIVKQKMPHKKYAGMSQAKKELFRKFNRAKRQAQNFVIQGASATITKLAMIRCHRYISANHGDQIKMILTLHDELQFEVREEIVPQFVAELPDLMCNLGLERFGFKLPLAIEVKVGPSWGELRRWEGSHDG
jgi:DNA polymerase-1